MRRTSKYFYIGMGIVIAYILIFFSVSFLINAGSNQLSTIYVAKVNGVPNFANPGSETFWQGVQSHQIPLIAADNYPPSGQTSLVTVQMAWTNSTNPPDLLIKMTFPNVGSGVGSVYSPTQSVPILNNTGYNNGTTLLPMYQNLTCTNPNSSCYGGIYPQDVGFFPPAIGSSYVYPEQAIVMLGVSPGANTDTWYQVSYKPKMVPGTSGALGTGTGGAAEFWIWSSSPTDNSSQDTAYPGLKYPNGTAMNPSTFGMPARASYAIDGYANVSSFYQIGGMPNSSSYPYINNGALQTANATQFASASTSSTLNPFEVQAKGVYNGGGASGNSWTVEFMRPLNTASVSKNGENNYQIQMSPTSPYNYHVAFAVSQGQASQTYLIYYNSVSFWWFFNFITPSGFNTPQSNPANSELSGLLVAILFLSLVGKRNALASIPEFRMKF